MTDVTYYKGNLAAKDFNFGTGTFNRKDKDLSWEAVNQMNLGFLPRRVVPKTAAYTIPTSIGTGEITFTNAAATGSVTFTLPPATAGMVYKFTVIAAYALVVQPYGSELFRDCVAGYYKTSDIAGNHLSIWCDVAGTWEWASTEVNERWANE